MTLNPYKRIRELIRKLEDMTADRDLWKQATEQAREDLKNVEATVAIVHTGGTTLITKEHNARMGRGGTA